MGRVFIYFLLLFVDFYTASEIHVGIEMVLRFLSMYFFLRFLVLKIYLNIPKFELCLSHCLKVTADELNIDFKTTKSTKKKCTCLRISVNMGTGYEFSDFHRSF